MPIVVACRCGQRFQAIAELAGKRVSCPACGQPLEIPSTNDPSGAVGRPLDLGDFSRFEQSAAASAPVGRAGGDPRRISVPAYAARHAQPEASLDRWLIVAMCVAGGVVLLVLGAIILSSLWSDTEGASGERPAGEAAAKNEPATAPAPPPADGAPSKTEQGPKPPAAAPQSPRTEMGAARVKPEPPASGTRRALHAGQHDPCRSPARSPSSSRRARRCSSLCRQARRWDSALTTSSSAASRTRRPSTSGSSNRRRDER